VSGTQRKGGKQVTVEVRESTSTSILRTQLAARAMELSSEEERVIRGVHGVSADRELRLQRKASGAVLDELLLMEMELHRRYRAHLSRPQPVPSPEKEKIVRALRSKK